MFAMIFIICLCVVVYLFVSRRASPIPYFPSNKKDINNIVQSLQLENDQVVYDLGAGDGVVIFSAATIARQKKLNTKFIAVEINPVLLVIMWLRRLGNPNRKNIEIAYGDIFNMRYKIRALRFTFFTYISPWFLEKVFKNAQRQKPKSRFVSYFYPIPNQSSSRTIKGVHSTYVYRT